MEIGDIKKDFKKIEISKNVIIIILAVALVLVSIFAICMATFRGHGYKREFGNYGMMGGQFQRFGYGGYYQNPNFPANSNKNPATDNNTQNAPTTPTAPKTQ